MFFLREFDHILLDGDENPHKYSDIVHSTNFDRRAITVYIFFVGAFAWCNVTSAVSHPILLAPVSHTASFALGYFNVIRHSVYYLMLYWIVSITNQPLHTVSNAEFEHYAIVTFSHAFVYVIGCVLYDKRFATNRKYALVLRKDIG